MFLYLFTPSSPLHAQAIHRSARICEGSPARHLCRTQTGGSVHTAPATNRGRRAPAALRDTRTPRHNRPQVLLSVLDQSVESAILSGLRGFSTATTEYSIRETHRLHSHSQTSQNPTLMIRIHSSLCSSFSFSFSSSRPLSYSRSTPQNHLTSSYVSFPVCYCSSFSFSSGYLHLSHSHLPECLLPRAPPQRLEASIGRYNHQVSY